jgi:hypothetical protein
MNRIRIFITLSFFLFSSISYALTWDEPWAEKVIRGSSSFILAKIKSVDEEKGISITIVKTLGGKALQGDILISNFYLLTICSNSGQAIEFMTQPMDSCYFFIKENEKGEYCIATPTTGFDYLDEGKVVSTYRHSYHQASVPMNVYEMTMTAIFNHYHDVAYDRKPVIDFVNEYLNKKPAGFSPNEIDIFFLQHAALESIYHLKLKEINEILPLPFLNDTTNFHHQVSAARALSAFNTATNKQALIKILHDTSRRNFVKVMCIWSLGELNANDLKASLVKLQATASDETDGFGGNFMDHRVCTSIPTVKDALTDLIAKW